MIGKCEGELLIYVCIYTYRYREREGDGAVRGGVLYGLGNRRDKRGIGE